MKLQKIFSWTFLFIFSLFTIIVLAADIPTDDQIAKILMSTNESEVSEAKLAQKNAHSRDVKKFADHVLKLHSKNKTRSMKLVKKLGLKPEDNEISMEVKKRSQDSIAMLKGLKGNQFDKAYIEAQIKDHEKLIGDLDNDLIPSAKNAKLKKMLVKTRTNMAKNLETAKRLKTEL